MIAEAAVVVMYLAVIGWLLHLIEGKEMSKEPLYGPPVPKFESNEELLSKLRRNPMTDDEREAIEMLCVSLNAAHDEIIRLQGGDPTGRDWPEFSHPANSIRMAEKLLGKKLAKTNIWTYYPEKRT